MHSNSLNNNKEPYNLKPNKDTIEKSEEGYQRLLESNSNSLLKKYLTQEIFDNLKNKQTTLGSTLLDCIQSGLENLDSNIGIYAPDAEAYTVFADIFDPIIKDYHNGYAKKDKHPTSNFGDPNRFGNIDPINKYIISTRIRCARSLNGFPFNPCLNYREYKEIEKKVTLALSMLDGELTGDYYPLEDMDQKTKENLINSHFLFKEGDRFLQSANACRFWPGARGIFFNTNRNFFVWINEEDHMRIISMQKGGDIGAVYRRLVKAVIELDVILDFSQNERLGYLTFCPTNLGTTIRASVHIRLPKLSQDEALLEEIAAQFNLQIRGTSGEHTKLVGGIYDISNKQRLGLTEYEAVKAMHDGIIELIKYDHFM